MTAAFFGHRDTPADVETALRNTVEELIRSQGADTFYLGNHGNFDRMAYKVLKELSSAYPHIVFTVVLAYMPQPNFTPTIDTSHTTYPEELEGVLRKYAISKRNRWMVLHCDMVIAHVRHSFGGAAQAVELARRLNKKIVVV